MQQKLFDKLKAAVANIKAAWKANDEGKEVLSRHGKGLQTVSTGLENML